ncbi:hypothetical protein D9615_001112 [Tricholomella constricta]|uniref:Zn(2)-C6 fungal-type domain-containing protein n=1 Tax=Tricholomella constricta TaxID=117010 RepID=A0A8H5HL19_9AGAR|nr:hypothetical protein D9615_001112 [Tricholomella constricta]
MSALPTDEPAQDASSSIDTQQLQQQLQQQQQQQHQQDLLGQPIQPPPSSSNEPGRKPKTPSVRRACIACHTGKTRCSEVLPCQSCIKRGLAQTCSYPDPDAQDHQPHHTPGMHRTAFMHDFAINMDTVPTVQSFAPPPMYATLQGTPTLSHQQYYDYNGTFTGASTSTFRPNKRPRNLTEEETAAITRNFSRGDFFVGNSAPVRIDPRLPVRLTLGEGDHVHFTVGEALV